MGGYLDQVITEGQLAQLAGTVPGSFSSLSPFKALQKKLGRAESPSGLPGAFVDGNGRLRSHAAAALQTLATANSFGSISFAGRGLVFESTVYFNGGEGDAGVSLTNRGEELRVQAPPAAAAAAEMLSLQTGESLLGRIELEAELSLGEGAVLFGCLDAVRRKELAGILEGSVERGYRVSHVEAALGAAEVDMQWLAPLYLRFSALPKLSSRFIRKALTALLAKDIIRKDQGGWKPSPLLRQAAAEVLLVDAHARLRQAAIGADGEATASDLRIVQGRSGALLLWTTDASTAGISGASAAQVSIMARDVLSPHPAPGGRPQGKTWPLEQEMAAQKRRYEAKLALVQAEADTVRADSDAVIDTVGNVPRGTRYVKWACRAPDPLSQVMDAAEGRVGGRGNDPRFDELLKISRRSVAEVMEQSGSRDAGQLLTNLLGGKASAAGVKSVIADAGETVLGRKQTGESAREGEERAHGAEEGFLPEEDDEDNSFTWL